MNERKNQIPNKAKPYINGFEMALKEGGKLREET